MLTERLEIRPPLEADRAAMVALWSDPAFTVFSMGDLDVAQANDRFDRMLATAAELSFAKQPVVERSSGAIVGYAGVDWFELDGSRELEMGWRLAPCARGKGYATEAASVVLDIARRDGSGWLYCIIDPMNAPSHRVAAKLGFAAVGRIDMEGPVDLLRYDLG